MNLIKILLVLATVGFGIASCKKNYACRCTTTISYSSRNDIYSSKTVTISEKLKKNQAESICQHQADNISATYYNIYTNSGQWISGTTFHTNCKVE